MRADRAAALLMERDEFVILTHLRPDGDTLGSAGALCRALRAAGKTAYCAKNPETTPRYAFLTEGLEAPDGFDPKTVVAVDAAGPVLLSEDMLAYGKPFMVIDHHPSNMGYGEHNLVNPDAAAAGEIIFEIILAMGVTLDRPMAEAIYTSVATDTGCFRYSNTTANTHRVAVAAIEAGISVRELNTLIFDTATKARIEVQKLFVNTMRFYYDDRICVARLTLDMIEQTGASEDDLDNFAGITKGILGVDAGIMLREVGGGKVKLSVRTSQALDASNICAEFGGGGHARAAGATITAGIDEVEKMIVSAAGQRL